MPTVVIASRVRGMRLALVGTLAVAAARVLAVPVAYVDDDYNSGTPGWGVTRFATISNALAAADAGGSVEVASGYYPENVVLSKRLLLRGPNAGIAGCGGRAVEALVDGGPGVALDIAVDGVTVDGMGTVGAIGIRNIGHVGVTIRNNAVTADAEGIHLESIVTTATSNVAVRGNCVVLSTQLAGGIVPTAGLVLSGVSGALAPVVSNNTVSAAFYGCVLYAVRAAAPTVIAGGDVSLVMQGVAVINVDPPTGTVYQPTWFGVDGVSMSAFAGDHPALPAYNFHAGVYVFTGGGDPAAAVSGTVTRVTVSGTGKVAANCAGLSFSDFSTNVGVRQQLAVDRCTLTGNLNRGLLARGEHAQVTVTRSMLSGNGSDPYGAGGNDGFGISVFNGATLDVSESSITNPASVAGGYTVAALAAFATPGGAAPTLTVRRCSLYNNGNPTGSLALQAMGTLFAASNWWGQASGPTHATNPYGTGGVVAGGLTFIPWLANGSDTSATPGFQPGAALARPPAHLVFTTQPGGGPPGLALGRQPAVSVRDALGAPTPWAEPAVTLALAANPGGGTLTGESPRPATGGVALFTNIAVTGGAVGPGYALSAAAPFLAGATSTVFELWHGVAGDIAGSTNWTPADAYALTGHVFVTGGAVLTLEAGTVVRGDAGHALVVTRGARIRVLGTPTNPVVFTDYADDHFVGTNAQAGAAPYALATNGLSGQWAGLIVLGSAVISGAVEQVLPGLEGYGARGLYGGTNDSDDSGELHYLSVRYAGSALGSGPGRGVTLAGVGRQTRVDHVEVFQSGGAGFGLLGGTVDAAALEAWGGAADAFECAEGYRGRGQFWLGVQGPLSGVGRVSDKGLELNGGMSTGLPVSVPTIHNATLVGLGAWTANSNNTALHFRDAAGGRIRSSLFLDFGGAGALIQGATNGAFDSADATFTNYAALVASYPAWYAPPADGKMLEVRHSTFWKMGYYDAGLQAPTNGAAWGGDAGPYYAYPLLTDTNLANDGWRAFPGNGEVYPNPVTQLTRTSTPVNVSGTNYYPVGRLNPLPNTAFYGAWLRTSGQVPPADGFFRPVWFRGAFDEQHNWAAPWSLAWRFGLLTGGQTGDIVGTTVDVKALGLDAGVVIPASQPLTVTLKVTAAEAAGQEADWWCLAYDATHDAWWYHVATPAPAHWAPWIGGVSYQAPLVDVTGYVAVDAMLLPPASYIVYFGVDLTRNGVIDFDGLLYDSVDVTITP